MALAYRNMDSRTRQEMAKELAADVAANDVYMSGRLNSAGRAQWATLLGEAAAQHDDAWLAGQIRSSSLLESKETATRNGKTFVKDVPVTAPEMLAEGEFNRLYIRGLCVRASDDGIATVIVYRARESANPRPESEAMIGQRLDPLALLQDLRNSKGKAPTILPYVNSGLSVHLP
jgi:hypothetical protein